ncbi:hypothetical protein ACVWY2_001150 [Bradyrhizobium sp. JR6.1]
MYTKHQIHGCGPAKADKHPMWLKWYYGTIALHQFVALWVWE